MPVTAPEIYLDHAASTPLRPAAKAAWLTAASRHHANPTGSHRAARHARRALDKARATIAAALGAATGEVVFTSGGSEADNLAIRGALGAASTQGKTLAGGGHAAITTGTVSASGKIPVGGSRAAITTGTVSASGKIPVGGGHAAITTRAEHHAVLDPVERSGRGVLVGTDNRGVIDCEQLVSALERHPDTAIVSVIAVNNETGTITPLRQVSRIVRQLAPDALLHTDAVQAVNWIDVASETADYDLVSVTGHKVGSPVGTGALVVRNGAQLDPLIVGGGQERGRRAGTPDVAGAAAFAVALDETVTERAASIKRLRALRDCLFEGLTDQLGERVVISAAPESSPGAERNHIAAGIANVCIAGISSEALLFLIDDCGVRASAASSCSSGAQDPSHVLAAMGIPRDLAAGSLRLSLGHTTTTDEIERAIDVIVASVRRLDSFGGG